MEKKPNTIIKTFDNDIYIIKGKTPDQVAEMIEEMDEVHMPNGSYIHRKSISAIQSYEDYTFQVDQKNRHRKGQYLKCGEWHDQNGNLGISAHLERITGDIRLKLPVGNVDKKLLPRKR